MSADPDNRDPRLLAALALHRFGLGPKPGGIDVIASDPRGAVLAELKPGVGRIDSADLLSTGEAARAAFDFRQQRRLARLEQQAQGQKDIAPPKPDAAKPETAKPETAKPETAELASKQPDAMQKVGQPQTNPPQSAQPQPSSAPTQQQNNQPANPGAPQQLYLAEAKARFDAAMAPEVGLGERLVWFWSNHFCVSADKVRPLCGSYEREAIRPHVLGKFSDMLLAVESHPAMLAFLDNAGSIGPQSKAGVRSGKGLNENLAREIMELHTLGVRTGYTQDDVTSFAKVITGWTVIPPRRDPERGGEFMFNPNMHEPGAQTVVSRYYREAGFEQGQAVLSDLARHPATAKHVATKLAMHFVADQPPPALVDRLATRFLDTEGDLLEVTKALVVAPEAWDAPRAKLKKPTEWTVAAMRACALPVLDVRRIVNVTNLLGEPLWRPPAPKGFSDDSAAWIDGLAERLDIANDLSRRIAKNLGEPDAMVDAALGPLASNETRQTVKRAESRPQALALLLMAPEFQRR